MRAHLRHVSSDDVTARHVSSARVLYRQTTFRRGGGGGASGGRVGKSIIKSIPCISWCNGHETQNKLLLLINFSRESPFD